MRSATPEIGTRPKAMPHENYVEKLLALDDPDQVFDERGDRDLPTEEVRPVGHAREAGSVDLVAAIAQPLSDARPAPTTPPQSRRPLRDW
jgi:hypothetical protein